MTDRPFPPSIPTLNATTLTDDARTILVRIIRVAFPHPNIPDAAYERTADKIVAEADASTWFRVVLTQGLNALNVALRGNLHWTSPTSEALTVLRRARTSSSSASSGAPRC